MKYSLHIGINHYPNINNDLDGCINDAKKWADVLQKKGFKTKLLIEEKATKRTILQEIQNIIAVAKRGDIAFITFSGHGTWVTDINNDESDGKDEALCPVDVSEGNIILDDELYILFSKRHWGAKVVFLSDSCHSGTLNMAIKNKAKIRFLAPENYMQKKSKVVEIIKRAKLKTIQSKKSNNALIMSACRDFEYSFDAKFGNKAYGVFSYYAIKTLLHLNNKASFNQWYKEIRRYLPNAKYPQTPQIRATAYQKYRWKLF